MSAWAILPTAGSGVRMKSDVPKPFLKLGGKTVIAHTLRVFEDCPQVMGVVVVGQEDLLKDLNAIVESEGFRKVKSIVAGGATRTQSVRNGLKSLPKEADIVLVHDGVRPLVTGQIIADGVSSAVSRVRPWPGCRSSPTLKGRRPAHPTGHGDPGPHAYLGDPDTAGL